MTDEQKDILYNAGALNYSHEKTSILLNIDKLTPEMVKIYDKGRIKADYMIEKKLLELAMSGDLKALNKLEEIREYNE